jgi:hypothetical protein
MKSDRYVWLILSVLLCSIGLAVLLDSIRQASPYADEYVLLGATLTALGLAGVGIVFGQFQEVRAMARHMRGSTSHLSRRSGAARTEDNS